VRPGALVIVYGLGGRRVSGYSPPWSTSAAPAPLIGAPGLRRFRDHYELADLQRF
jgi:hypothetical protein